MSSLLDRAIANARDALNKDRRARFRLKDILTEEVSFVDRAANKRRFLLVKRDGTASSEDLAKQAPSKDMSRDELRAAREKRSKQFGIEVLDKGSNLTFPSGFPTKLSEYGDPVNLKFPVETKKRAANARTRFKQFADRYSATKSKRVVHTRIVEAELQHGVKPDIDSKDPLDTLLPATLRERAAKSEGDSMIILSARVRDELAKSLADGIERLVAFAKALREVEVSDESEDKHLPSEMGDELTTLVKELGEPLTAFVAPAEKSEGVVSGMLAELGEVAMALSEQAGGEEELSGDTIAKVQRLSTLLDSLIEKYPRPTAKAGEEPVNKTTDKKSDPAADDIEKRRKAATNDDISAISEAAKGLKNASKLLTGLADKLKGDNPSGEPAKKDDASGTSDSQQAAPADQSDLASMMGKLTEAVTALVDQNKSREPDPSKAGTTDDADKDNGGEPTAKSDAKDEISKRLEALEADNKRLRDEVAKAVDDPPGSASGSRTATTKNSGEPRLFPSVYGDPIHDPQPAGQA